MSEIRRFPEQDKRVETGLIQFGDDWPGLFMRGDNALWYAICIQNLLMGGPSVQAAAKMSLAGLRETLLTCNLRPTAASPVPKEETPNAPKR